MTTKKTLQEVKDTVKKLFGWYTIKESTYTILLNEEVNNYERDSDILALKDSSGKNIMIGELFYEQNIMMWMSADLKLSVKIEWDIVPVTMEWRPTCDTDRERADEYRDLDDDDADDYEYIDTIIDNYIAVWDTTLNSLLINYVWKKVTIQFISLTD